MEMELLILFLTLTFNIIFYKLKIPVLVLLTALFGMIITYQSLSVTIPFSPFTQIFCLLPQLILSINAIIKYKEW